MYANTVKLGKHEVGAGAPSYLIAEMSANHLGSLERALDIMLAAKQAGADAVKLQTYTADTITIDHHGPGFDIEGGPWAGRSLYELYQEAHTPWKWHDALFSKGRELEIDVFSSPFDESAIEFLEKFDPPAYKIASFENIDLPLIRKVAATGKPLIISVGMATLAEIDDAVRAAREAGCSNLVLLKCTSTYPASPENSNVITLPHMRELFNCEVGLSDHTMGVGASVAAVAHGAVLIEKHFTISRADGGVDSAFSLEPDELRTLVIESERAWRSLGAIHYGPTEDEKKSIVYRRSLYIVQDIRAGEVLTTENMRCIRPGMGLPPKYYNIVLGKRVNRDAKKGTAVAWELLN